MKTFRSRIRGKVSVFPVAVAALISMIPTAQGQDAERVFELEPLGVIGSQLPLALEERFSPVTLVSAEDLSVSIARTPVEALRQLPGLVGSTATENDSNGGTGAAGINLRGMGSSSSLILINGRRAGSFSDVNQIPMTGLLSIQLLHAGAAATYGADALAGAVNFQFDDLPANNSLNLLYGNTSRRDSAVYQMGFVTAVRNNGLRMTIAGEYYRRDTIYARDRGVSRSPDMRPYGGSNLGDPTLPGSAYFLNPAITGFSQGILRDGVGFPQSLGDYRAFDYSEDLYNYRETTPAIPGQERHSIYSSLNLDLSDRIRFFADFLLTDIQQFNGYAPAPFGVPFASPYSGLLDPNAWPYPVYRTLELGPRRDTFRFNSLRTVVGLKGRLNQFNWESAFLYNRAKGHNTMSGFPELNALIDETESGAFNPYARAYSSGTVVVFGNSYSWDNSEALRRASGTARDHYDSILRMWDFKINGSIWDLPGGALDIAAGLEYREEDSGNVPDPLVQQGRVLGFNQTQPFAADRTARAGFLESKIPVFGDENRINWVHALEVNAGIRHERFQYNGVDPATGAQSGPRLQSTDQKLGLRYQPASEWTLRSSYSTGFRAPTSNEIFSADGTDFPTVVDPLGFTPGLFQTMVNVSGNVDLKPETSSTWAAGVAWSPRMMDGLYVSVDYYSTSRRNVIGDSTQLILNLNAEGQGAGFPDASDPTNVVFDPGAPFANRIFRNPDGSLGMNQVHVDAERFNVAENRIQGIELALAFGHTGPLDGFIRHDLMMNYFIAWDLITAAGTPAQNYVGRFRDPSTDDFSPGSIPRYKGFYRVSYEIASWFAAATLQYTDSFYDDPFFLESVDSRKVGSWTTLDLLLEYRFGSGVSGLIKDLTIGIAAENIFDRPPPVAVGAFNDNYDTSAHSIRGRSFYLRVRKDW